MEGQIADVKGGLEGQIADFKGGLERQITDVEKRLTKKIQENTDEIRHNGILIEQNKDSIDLLAEGNKTLNDRFGRLETDVTYIKEKIVDYSIIRETIKKHGRQLSTLQK